MGWAVSLHVFLDARIENTLSDRDLVVLNTGVVSLTFGVKVGNSLLAYSGINVLDFEHLAVRHFDDALTEIL